MIIFKLFQKNYQSFIILKKINFYILHDCFQRSYGACFLQRLRLEAMYVVIKVISSLKNNTHANNVSCHKIVSLVKLQNLHLA